MDLDFLLYFLVFAFVNHLFVLEITYLYLLKYIVVIPKFWHYYVFFSWIKSFGEQGLNCLLETLRRYIIGFVLSFFVILLHSLL